MTRSASENAVLDPHIPAIAAERAADYRRAGLWSAELVGARIQQRCRSTPDRCAIVDGARRLTYGELGAAVNAAALALLDLGVKPSDRVATQLSNCVEYVVLVLALLEIGAPPVLILPALREHELDHILAITEPVAFAVETGLWRSESLAVARTLMKRHACLRHLLIRGDGAGPGEELIEFCRPGIGQSMLPQRIVTPQDAAVFLLSGGTTGLPKAIPRTHESYGYMIRIATAIADVSEQTVNLVVMPAEHGFVMNCPGILGTLSEGGRVVLATPVSPRAAFELIEHERVTHTTLVPTLALQWIAAAAQSAYDVSSLEVIQVGGARLEADTAAELHRVLGAQVQQCYGMSEGLLCYTRLDDPDDVVNGTQGRPASPMDEIRVVDTDGAEVATGEMGELLTRGPYTVAGYYRSIEATAQDFTDDGFYRTGDVVRIDDHGNVVVEGRVKDVINRAGEKISAQELEAVALRHPRIALAAGVAMPHPLYGEAVCLYTVVDRSSPAADAPVLDLRAVRRFLEQQGLARYKFPERLEIVTKLPLTAIGKIDKGALRKDIAARLAIRCKSHEERSLINVPPRSSWVKCIPGDPSPQHQLVCFPHAGGGASFYRPWRTVLPPQVELLIIQYPGREDRMNEPAVDSFDQLVKAVATHLASAVDRACTFFGHSMGSLVAYEVMRRWELLGIPAPDRLIVSSQYAPDEIPASDIHRRDNDEVLDEIDRLGGTPSDLRCNPELAQLVADVARADYRLVETYEPLDGNPVTSDLTVFCGDADPVVTPEQAMRWARFTTAEFTRKVFSGGHFYLRGEKGTAIYAIADIISHGTAEELSR